VLLAVALIASNGLGNASLEYLNYPTKVIIRSCKLIPVMGAGMCFGARSYPPLEYGAALLLVLGTVLFNLADVGTSPRFHLLGAPVAVVVLAAWLTRAGVLLCSASVLFDAVFSNLQELLLQRHRAPIPELVCDSDLFAGCAPNFANGCCLFCD
jgi:hypothetical protein